MTTGRQCAPGWQLDWRPADARSGSISAVRIVSLLPSATEIVYALGRQDDLVGVTDECDYPLDALTRRVVVRSRQPAGLSAGAIDAWVRSQAARGGLYVLDEAALTEIGPDLVLTQDLCRVCAVPTADVDVALARVGSPARVVTLEPQTLDDVLTSVVTVARAAGVAGRGADVRAGLRDRLAVVAEAVAGRPRVRTLVLEWLDPPFTAGHWVPDVVVAAGGQALLGNPGGRSGPTDWATICASRPEALVLAPCGTTAAQTWAQSHLLPAQLRLLPTVAADLARPGPRLVDAVEALAAWLHPGAGLAPRPDVLVPRD
jgi:iron complex transport system substrate-binding protein